MRKKVLLKIYAEQNLGDDLFLKLILEKYPAVDFYIEAPKIYSTSFKEYENAFFFFNTDISFLDKIKGALLRKLMPKLYKKRISNMVYSKLISFSQKCDYFVSIGGSIFMQPKILPAYSDIEYYKNINKLFNNKSKFLIGCNFGPYLSNDYLNEYTNIFKSFTDVCFREEKSYKLFSNLKNVRYTVDTVFGLDYSKEDNSDNAIVGFTIISPRNNVDKQLYVKKYQALITYYKRKGYQVYLYSFCKVEGDENWIESILRDYKDLTNITSVYYNGDLDNFLEEYKKPCIMYCSRFHATILSMLLGQKICPIAYSEKLNNVLKDINYEGVILSMEEFVKKDVEVLNTNIVNNEYNLIGISQMASEQFRALDKVLRKN